MLKQEPKICVTIREETTAATLAAIERVAPLCDLIEVRADFIRDLDLRRLLPLAVKPVIFTCRPQAAGGNFAGTEGARLELLVAAAGSGADYLDVEIEAEYQRVCDNKGSAQVIISYHNFEGTPADLEDIYRKLQATPADIVKISTLANSLSDTRRIFDLLLRRSPAAKPLIAVAMGERGVATRVLGPAYGSFLTYASESSAMAAASGQIPLADLLTLYRIRSLTGRTRVLGVLGKPLGHSMSPVIHNAALASRDLDYLFLPFEADSLQAFFELIEIFPIAGFSVTIPYKTEIIEHLDEIDDLARGVGAVNTVVVRGGKLFGTNTDVLGFIEPLRQRVQLKGKKVVVLGAGGAARAAVYALVREGAHVVIVNRTAERGRKLAQEFGVEHSSYEALADLSADVLINATPVGMHPRTEETPVPGRQLRFPLVYDLVYNPIMTRLLREAQGKGCQTLSGLEMFVRQAAEQFRLWTGEEAPLRLMREAVIKRLYEQER